jgi:hypothetical protein
MIIQLVYGILIMEKKFINTNLIIIWQLYQQSESIKMLHGIINNKTYITNQLINFYSSLYSSSWDKTVRCFDIETGQEIVC